MRFGKLDTSELKSLVLSHISKNRSEVVLSASMGEDCAALDIDDYVLLSSDPITASLADSEVGSLAVDVACNDIASNGGIPVALMITLIVPPSCEPNRIGEIMKSVTKRASEIDVDVVGGHTEFSDSVVRPIISATAVGRAKKIIKKSGITNGDKIYITKFAGLEGTVILFDSLDDSSILKLNPNHIKTATQFKKMLSVIDESLILTSIDGVTSMHDITEGGVLGAVCEICQGVNLGAEVYQKNVPIAPITSEICEELSVNPLRLISSGSLMFTFNGDVSELNKLTEKGINYSQIGVVTSGNEVLLFASDDKVLKIESKSDELWTQRAKEV